MERVREECGGERNMVLLVKMWPGGCGVSGGVGAVGVE